MRKLESKRRHFSPSKTGTAMAVPAVPLPPALHTIAATRLVSTAVILNCSETSGPLSNSRILKMYNLEEYIQSFGGQSCLRRCDERTHVNTCVNKSLVQALESCPSSDVTPCTCCSANLSTFSRVNSKSAGLYSKCIHGQAKLDAILREPCSYYGSASV